MPRKKEHLLDYLDFAALKILQTLKDGVKTFSELDEASPLSTPNFDRRLNELINLGLVKEVFKLTERGRAKKMYSLTSMGKHILELLEEIEEVYREGFSLKERELRWVEKQLDKQTKREE